MGGRECRDALTENLIKNRRGRHSGGIYADKLIVLSAWESVAGMRRTKQQEKGRIPRRKSEYRSLDGNQERILGVAKRQRMLAENASQPEGPGARSCIKKPDL